MAIADQLRVACPKENVKAAVPQTPQAQEAVIANDIPQTATVSRTRASFTPLINGTPDLKPVPDTPLMYVVNSPTLIIMVSQYTWYAVQNGVWFTASSVQGPWVVATSVPPVIYSIPPSSPISYVTYVKIYDVTPQSVVVGYTPGYMGTVVTTDGVVVYGTGYTYAPYIGTTVWYLVPVTYGYAANPTWTPWTGWVIGFGFGWAMGAMATSGCCWGYAPAPYWGAMPYAPYYGGYAYGPHGGAAAWGPGGWAATTGNVYQHWGATTAVSRGAAGYNAWTGNAWGSGNWGGGFREASAGESRFGGSFGDRGFSGGGWNRGGDGLGGFGGGGRSWGGGFGGFRGGRR